MAETIIKEWLAISSRNLVSPVAQKMEKVLNNETALMGVVKYGSKIFTELDVNKKALKKGESDICAAALNNIFASMKGLRISERFGFNLPKSSKETQSTVVRDYCEWKFAPSVFDWINPDNDAALSCYVPSEDLVNLLEYNINKKAE